VCNGPPGERHYTKGYYAAFVFDPLGNNIEVMCWDSLKMKFLINLPTIFAGVGGVIAAVVAYQAAKYF
jgi:hypothetical protein